MLTQLVLNNLNKIESLLLTHVSDNKLSILIDLIEAVAGPTRDISKYIMILWMRKGTYIVASELEKNDWGFVWF